jgi:hypothetical protein
VATEPEAGDHKDRPYELLGVRMSSQERRYSRQELLAAVEKGWKHYLAYLAALSREEQARYARAQGYARIEDVVAHIFAWWELSMQRTREVLSGKHIPIADDMDEFNASVVAHYQGWTLPAIEEKFATALTTFERFLRHLSESALDNDRIQLWLRLDSIDHYEDHKLPNAPSVREV